MIGKILPAVYANIRTTDAFLIGTDTITRTRGISQDWSNLALGLTLWCGILSDFSNFSAGLAEGPSVDPTLGHKAKSAIGRINSYVRLMATCVTKDVDLTPFLTALDSLATLQLRKMAQLTSFKHSSPGTLLFLGEVAAWKRSLSAQAQSQADGDDEHNPRCNRDRPLDELLVALLGAASQLLIETIQMESFIDERCITSMSWFRQITSFLNKIVVERKSLRAECAEATKLTDTRLRHFVESCVNEESSLWDETRAQQWRRNTDDMRKVLVESGLAETWDTILGIVPCHGQGVVGEPGVKTWFEKYRTMAHDARISYLLRHSDLGTVPDYNPLITENDGSTSTRESRFIAVPKNWKKMRGISAEPAELQYWQQGVLHSLDRALRRNIFWRNRVNIHDQTKSQQLALAGSVKGTYATIDLSEASDCVSTRLVHDVFGNTELSRWLLGTRSVRTDFGDGSIWLSKFAPMGSATCFVVECIIFALAAEVAVRRTRPSLSSRFGLRVYGDDIIVPTYAYRETVDILVSLGFTVNMDKSFHTGGFRESCGAEAWLGTDIRPVRFKSLPINGLNSRISLEVTAAGTLMLNAFFMRGFYESRSFLSELLFSTYFTLHGRGKAKDQKLVKYPSRLASFFTFDGDHSTVASPTPTNFHLRRKYDSALQTTVWEVLVWRKRRTVLAPVESNLDLIDACRLVEWLIRHPNPRVDADEPIPYQCISRPTGHEGAVWSHIDWKTETTLSPRIQQFYKERPATHQEGFMDVLVHHDPDATVTRPERMYHHIAQCGILLLKEAIQSYQELDDRFHLCFTKASQSFANMGSLGRDGAPYTMVPTIKWVDPAWLADNSTYVALDAQCALIDATIEGYNRR